MARGALALGVGSFTLTVDRAAAIACYLQALCAMLLERLEPPPREDDYLVYTFNRFQACRFGLDGIMVNPASYQRISIREDIINTIGHIRPFAERLGAKAALQHILDMAIKSNNDATYLRDTFDRNGSVESVVGAAIAKMRSNADQ